MAEQWMSIVEYARTFNISDMTIRRRIRTGKLQALLRDGKYYIPIETDPASGAPIKQNKQKNLRPNADSASYGSNQNNGNQAHHHPVKSHPNADRTLNSSSSFSQNRPVERSENHSSPVVRPNHISQTVPDQNKDFNQAATINTYPDLKQRNQSIAPQSQPAIWEQIPYHISAPVAQEQEVLVESQALLEYCNSSLANIKSIEKHIEQRYTARLETTYEQIRNRDIEISRLNQQIEDLQLLVQILEKKRP